MRQYPKVYPKARGLMVAWVKTQDQRQDMIGELARVLNTATDAPKATFRQEPWEVWAVAHGLTIDHVEAMFKEYAYVSTDEKRAAYDKLRNASRAQRAQCVQQ